MYISLNNKKYEYHPNRFQSFYSIKEDINTNILKKNKINIDSSQIILFYKHKVLDNKKTPQHYNIKKYDIIYLKIKTEGGKKSTTASQVILLIVGIFLLLILIIYILMGILPFFSFLISKILIKGITLIIDFLRSLTDYNNFINSFLATVKSVFVPIISFILYYFGLLVIVFFCVFYATYFIYNFIYKDCRAFKASKMLATITVIVLVLVYVIANLPNMIKKISAAILPGFINSIVAKICDVLSSIRLVIIGAIPFIGAPTVAFIDTMTLVFEMLNKSKFYGPKFLYEWDKMFQWMKTPEMEKTLREQKLKVFVDGIDQANKFMDGKTVGDNPYTNLEFSGFVFARWAFQTVIYLAINFVEIFDLCGDKPETLIRVEQEIKKTNQLINDITSQLNDPSTDNADRKEMRQSLQSLTKTAAKLFQNKEREEKMKMLDVPCLREILINGAMTAFPTFLIFLILFILFCIPQMLSKAVK